MTKVESVERYQEIVRQYNRKGCAANDYIQREVASLVLNGSLFEHCGANNAFLFVKKPVGYRLYYYVNDFSECLSIGQGDFVVELLYRTAGGMPKDEISYFKRNGFETAQLRYQYSGVYSDLKTLNLHPDFQIDYAQDLHEVGCAARLFNESFDPMTGLYVAEDEYASLLANKRIVVAREWENGDFLGAVHFIAGARVSEWLHLAVAKHARGRGVGSALCDAFAEYAHVDEHSRFIFFARPDNLSGIRMYLAKGFKHNGKASLSMVRRSVNAQATVKF